MSLLLLHGIIETSGESNDEQQTIKLTPNYNDKYLMLVGDGLSQARVKTFEQLIEKSSCRFDIQHKMSTVLQEAFGQVINVTGDLHSGCFHRNNLK